MKRILIAAALASASLGLVGCNPPTPPAPTPSASNVGTQAPTAGNVERIADSAMFAAEASYNVVANAYVEADTSGILKPEIKAKVKPLMAGAYDWLLKARIAYEAGDRIGFYNARENLEKLANEASKLLPKGES